VGGVGDSRGTPTAVELEQDDERERKRERERMSEDGKMASEVGRVDKATASGGSREWWALLGGECGPGGRVAGWEGTVRVGS
jgi:hypothetical protein